MARDVKLSEPSKARKVCRTHVAEMVTGAHTKRLAVAYVFNLLCDCGACARRVVAPPGNYGERGHHSVALVAAC